MSYAGRRVLILGLAREGISLAGWLSREGAEVTATDESADLGGRGKALAALPIRLCLGRDYPELIAETDVLFVSPGVPETNPVYRAARDQGVPVESMTTLFFERCPGRIIGVTGSSGKTTTTGLIGHILREAGRDVRVGGNIGEPMLDLLPTVTSTTDVVLELSSFQLDILRRSPSVAVVTNISPNHLDRHGTMEAYIQAKLNIVRHQSPNDHAVLNADDPTAERFAAETKAEVLHFGGRLVEGNELLLPPGRRLTAAVDVPLLGRHNLENVSAAAVTADLLGVPTPVIASAIRTFRPAPHRLQTVAERGGVRYIDDSIATSPARASVALQAIDAPVLLIAGGRDKRLPWDDFARLAVRKVRSLYLIGEAAPLIEDAVRRQEGGILEHIARCRTLTEAVKAAGSAARPGDVVLLSPGCASYDMFKDFEERGRLFAQSVEALSAA
ncbi:MAG TPA: UDP-N-acetylmuramoyl-L-alanine--D-glutamate ligase [Chloroflexota bacterium]|nr:UDP-N-acetylmuramoyl-L-alanine--D-glutamate ligase [Chloroflexota bacterium]